MISLPKGKCEKEGKDHLTEEQPGKDDISPVIKASADRDGSMCSRRDVVSIAAVCMIFLLQTHYPWLEMREAIRETPVEGPSEKSLTRTPQKFKNQRQESLRNWRNQE